MTWDTIGILLPYFRLTTSRLKFLVRILRVSGSGLGEPTSKPAWNPNEGPEKKTLNPKPWVLPPLSNRWIITIIGSYIALNRILNINCYWGGQYPTLNPKLTTALTPGTFDGWNELCLPRWGHD